MNRAIITIVAGLVLMFGMHSCTSMFVEIIKSKSQCLEQCTEEQICIC